MDQDVTGINATLQSEDPVNTVAPSVSGTTAVGATLTATNGQWEHEPSLFDYEWLALRQRRAATLAVIDDAGRKDVRRRRGWCAVTGSAWRSSRTTGATKAFGAYPHPATIGKGRLGSEPGDGDARRRGQP